MDVMKQNESKEIRNGEKVWHVVLLLKFKRKHCALTTLPSRRVVVVDLSVGKALVRIRRRRPHKHTLASK